MIVGEEEKIYGLGKEGKGRLLSVEKQKVNISNQCRKW